MLFVLYIDKVTIHNFKSFKHANIMFSRGFNCIVGPNGSGKSNICDALLFSLGESSFRRMRVTNSSKLISNLVKPDKETKLKRAYVTIDFSGDQKIQISRVVRSDGKIGYRIGGKKAKRQDVLDLLHANNCWANETNTITQGEIIRILNLNSKERRGLIDIASGIKEFDDKKNNSLKELEKVEEKIGNAKIMLSERTGFIEELKKDKEDAERYIATSDSIKSISYTILKKRESQVYSALEDAMGSIARFEEKKKTLSSSISEIDKKMEDIAKLRSELSKKLSEKSIEVNSVNRNLDEISKGVAIAESEVRGTKESIASLKTRINELTAEDNGLGIRIADNKKIIVSLRAEIESRSKSIEKIEVHQNQEADDFASGEYESMQKSLDALSKEFDSVNGARLSAVAEISRASDSIEMLSLKASDLEKSIKEWNASVSSRLKDADAVKSKIAKGRIRIKELHEKQSAITKSISALDEKSIDIREAIAASGGGTDRMNDEIKREIKQGFHGRAYELCTYEDKYSNAIIAAAGSRFNYFVVESISVATSAIKLIRDKKLGRASFIPMADIYGKKPAVQEGVTPIIDLVKFDKKYEKVFSFVFANTYLVNTIADGKKHGLGNLRYVTKEGDILEPSGVVSGGFSRQVAYPGKLRLELEKVAGQKQELLKEIAMVESELESEKKAVGSLEVDLAGSEIEIKRMNSSISLSSGELLTIKSEIDAKSKSVKGTEREIEAYASKCSNLAKEISAIKEKQALSYKAMSTALHAGKSSKASKEEIETAKKQRAELESLKMQYASVSKENDMLDLRIAAIKDEMRKASDTINKLNAAVKEKEAYIAKGVSSKAELEEMIRSHDKGSESIYNELLKLEKSLSEMGFQKGRLTGESDKLAKELSEAETKKAQAQTRLNDIKAELSGRAEVEEAKGSINELESRLAVLKNDLEKMGVVNLKAPEMYEIKSKDLEGAIEKLDTLENEKTSILGMIKEIESKKLDVFMDTFKAVERNMQKLYNYTYDDEVVMSLDNPKDPFNSGLSISVRKKDKGGRIKSVDELSGGQKSFILIVMLFAIQMRNRMSFYIFDEIDSALDKENSKKLSKLIKEISSNSQFIVVSHNDTLISAADTAIGFSMQNDESKAVGIQLVGVGK